MVNFSIWILLFSILITSLLQFSSSQKAYPTVSCIARERRALLQFRNGLIDGSNWFSSWSGENCCTWKGIGCNKNTGHVVKLDLRNTNQSNIFFEHDGGFRGEINSSLLALEHLIYLDLSMNNFSGIPIPAFFGSLKYLKYLNLSGSYFMGNIPQNLGNLSHLQHLDLSSSFRRSLASESMSWVSKLSSLKSLDLSFVNLNRSQDWFQAINILPSLISLKLRLCRLPFLPNLLHVNLTSLKLFDLFGNYFNSTIPLSIFNMTSLKYLDLSANYFHGLIPNEVAQLTSLTFLDLGYNYELMNPLPNSLGSLSSLHQLNLRHNKFSDSLPLGMLCNLTSLEVLDLSMNKFQGLIPRDIGCFRQLFQLRLGSNELNGTIPSNLGFLSNLEILDISSNSLIGEISEIHFVKLKKLKYLELDHNSLTFNISSSWSLPFQLQGLSVNSVRMGPQFPAWLRTQKNLDFLSMSNASISDEIPDWFEVVDSHINQLDLSLNKITGKVPKFSKIIKSHPYINLSSNKFEAMSSYWFPSDIIGLDLSGNHLLGPIPLPKDLRISFLITLLFNDNYFSGSIPESICRVRNLKFLDLSNNQLSGTLPLCLGKLRNLIVLRLSNNSLYGKIPSSLGNIEFLGSLTLNRNNFHGNLPKSMQYLIHMQFLDLGENKLEGIIPSWISKYLLKLRVLRLQSNHFHGHVPTHLCQLSELQVLNLAQNHLTGFIPWCLKNLSAMAANDSYFGIFQYITGNNLPFYTSSERLISFMSGRELEFKVKELKSLDLSQNNIVGGIPNELMDLVGLQSLKLSGNHLSGNIPERIGNLKELLSLDLSINELSGSIPQSLVNLNFLSFLNLSSNKLSGKIPTGNQLQTLDDPSIYAGNSGLCGKPLSNNCLDEKSTQESKLSVEYKNEENSIISWFYAGFGPGFAVGLLLVFCILLFKKSWRIAYFRFVENFCDNIWTWIVLKTSKL